MNRAMDLGHRRSGRLRILLLLAVIIVLGSANAEPAQSAPSGVNTAAGSVETYRGIPVGFTADGEPFRGNPNATLTLLEYSDLLCPFCERYFSQTLPTLLEKYVSNGQLKVVLRDLPLASLHPTAPRGAAAAGCVGEQGAARFWAMYEALFQVQREWSRLSDPTTFLAKLASQVGADMAAYEACMASGRQETRVQRSVAAAQALGFNGTPTFQFLAGGKTYTLVGAHPAEVFNRWIDALLAGKEPPKEEQTGSAQARKPELPFWAKPEGLAPDPNRPGFTVAGDRYRGSPEARVVLIEFEDFQCPACQRHALTTQPELDKRFVETGQVRWVVKHFPLGIHPRAPVAAAAAQCAGDQSKFWPMHRALFGRMEQWATADEPAAVLTSIATEIGLEKSQFATCLASRQALEPALRDLYDGQTLGVRSVPSFVLFHEGAPVVLVGTRSLEQFAALLQRLIENAKSEVAPAAVREGSGR